MTRSEADVDFSLAFYLLPQFHVGLDRPRPTDEETLLVAAYLGIDLPPMTLDERIGALTRELSRQNGVLTMELRDDAIFQSEEYAKSTFVRGIVANNRNNRQRRRDGA